MLNPDKRTQSRLPRAPHCLGERGFAQLKGCWRTLQHTTASPRKIGDIAHAALVLTHFEHSYLAATRWDHVTEPSVSDQLIAGA
ncbi:hypothetical protein ACWEJ6_40830 [Nonomuraea sp. NPDC004702]